MAGEWIPVDIALGSKPEVQELVDLSGQGVEVVVYRLLQLWGWASLNSADGTARATPERLARVCGGEAEFWRHVESVGWIEFDAEVGTATIPGWGRRFSMAAKARACKNDRQRRYADAEMAQQRQPRASRGEERTDSSSSARKAARRKPEQPAADTPAAGWDALQAAWNAGRLDEDPQRWRSPAPPQQAAARLAEAGWLELAQQAIQRLPQCRYFRTPVTLPQLCVQGFVDRVLGGQYDKPPAPKAGPGPRGPDDRPPAQGFTGDDAARFEATRRALADKLRQEAAPA